MTAVTEIINLVWNNIDKTIPYYVGDFKITVSDDCLLVWLKEDGWRDTPIKHVGQPLKWEVIQHGKPVAEINADGKIIILTQNSKLAKSIAKISVKRFITWAKKQYA